MEGDKLNPITQGAAGKGQKSPIGSDPVKAWVAGARRLDSGAFEHHQGGSSRRKENQKNPTFSEWKKIFAAQQNIRAQMQRIDTYVQEMFSHKEKKQRNISTEVSDRWTLIASCVEIARSECNRLEAVMMDSTRFAAKEDPSGNQSMDVDLIGTANTPRAEKNAKRPREPAGNSPEQSSAYQKVDDDSQSWKKQASRKVRKRQNRQPAEVNTEEVETNRRGRTDETTTPAKGKKNRTRLRRKDGGAILIKPANNKTYADVLLNVKKNVDPDKSHVKIQTYRQTKDGSLLLRVRSENDKRETFKKEIQDLLGEDGCVKDTTTLVQLDILDLDCVTETTDITDALRPFIGKEPDPKVCIFGPNKGGQYMAVCHVDNQTAQTLLKTGLKVGWVNCRVRRRLTVPKCFKCLGYGHTKKDCKGTDRRDVCWKCGLAGHVGKACNTKDPTCFLCSEANHDETKHTPGSGKCKVFRDALEECKKKTR